MNRRAFSLNLAKVLVTVAVAGSFLGCPSASSVFSAISKYVPVGLQAFSSVLNLLTAAGLLPPGSGLVIQFAIAGVKAAFADITVAVQDYQAAPAANKATLLGKISTAVADAEAHLQLFWSNLNLPAGNTASLAEGLLQLVVSTLMGFATQLPPVMSTPAHKELMARRGLARRVIVATPKVRSAAQFKAEFNHQLPANLKEYSI